MATHRKKKRNSGLKDAVSLVTAVALVVIAVLMVLFVYMYIKNSSGGIFSFLNDRGEEQTENTDVDATAPEEIELNLSDTKGQTGLVEDGAGNLIYALDDEVDLGFWRSVVSPGIKLHGNTVKPQGMADLVLVGDTDSLEGKSQPCVGYGGVEVLLPVVLRSDFLGESEVKEREEVHQLIIGILHLWLSVHFGDVPSDEVAVYKVVKLLGQGAA